LHQPGGPGHPEIGRAPQAGPGFFVDYYLDYRNFSQQVYE